MLVLPTLKSSFTQINLNHFQRDSDAQTQSAQLNHTAVQSESSLQDINTIVLVANASLFNFRTELPIYTDRAQNEFTTTAHFRVSLAKMGLKRLI